MSGNKTGKKVGVRAKRCTKVQRYSHPTAPGERAECLQSGGSSGMLTETPLIKIKIPHRVSSQLRGPMEAGVLVALCDVSLFSL